MQNERVILGAALGLENPGLSLLVQAVGAQTVDRLRGQRHQLAPPQKRGGLLRGVRRSGG